MWVYLDQSTSGDSIVRFENQECLLVSGHSVLGLDLSGTLLYSETSSNFLSQDLKIESKCDICYHEEQDFNKLCLPNLKPFRRETLVVKIVVPRGTPVDFGVEISIAPDYLDEY
jgi:hypothetical protein